MIQSQDRWQGAERDQPMSSTPQRAPGIIYAPQKQPAPETPTQRAIEEEHLKALRKSNANSETNGADNLTPEAVHLLAQQYILDGKLPPLGMGRQAASARQAIINEAARLAGVAGKSGSDLAAGFARFRNSQHTLQTLDNQLGTIRGNESTALANAQQFLDRIHELYPPNSTRLGNMIRHGINEFLNDPTQAAYNSAYTTFLTEYAKVVAGSPSGSGVLSDSARREQMDNLSQATSPEAAEAAVKQMQADMENRVQALQANIERGYGNLSAGRPASFAPNGDQLDEHGKTVPVANPSDGTIDPLTGSPTQRLKPDEELHFNDAPAAPRAQHLPPEQEAQVLEAARSGDVGQTVALLEKFTGKPSDRASIEKAVNQYRANPKAGISLNYSPGDQGAQDAYDREHYGEYLKPALEGRKDNALPSAGRGILSGLTLGAAPYVAAAGNALLSGQSFDDRLKYARALDEADYRINPVSRIGGEIAGGAVAFPAAEAGMARVGAELPGVVGAVARSPATADALAGGTNAYLNSQDNGVGNGIAGAAISAGTGILGRTAGRGIAPTGGASRPLYEAGVLPTPGQRLGGVANVAEQGLETIPIVGGMVRGARQQARNQFERGAFDDSLKEIGHKLPDETELGTKAHAFAQNKFSEAYANARAGMQATLDDEFHKGFDDLAEHINAGGIPEDSAKRFKAIVGNAVNSRLQGMTLTGDAYKDAATKIDKQIRTLRNSPSADQELAGALEDFSGLLDQAARRSSPPEAVKALDDTDRGYAKFVRIESAAKSAEAPGRFTPKQYANAVMKESGGRAARSKAFLRGDALGQDYATAGLRLGEPSTGVPRAVKEGTMLGLLGGTGALLHSPTVPIGAALATLPYAPVVREATNRILAPREGEFAQLLAKIGRNTTTGVGAAYTDRPTKGRKSKSTLLPVGP